MYFAVPFFFFFFLCLMKIGCLMDGSYQCIAAIHGNTLYFYRLAICPAVDQPIFRSLFLIRISTIEKYLK